MNLSAYTISPESITWLLEDIPHYNNTEQVTNNIYNAFEYISQLANKRNNTVKELLRLYPETTHILCCDSYYTTQINSIKRLINDYTLSDNVILGGGVWSKSRMRFSDIFNGHIKWDDKWSVNELKDFVYEDNKFRTDWLKVSSVPGIHIFPRSIWDKGVRYGAYENTDIGCEITYFCHNSNTSCYIDFGTFFYRERIYPIMKCIRCSLGLRSRLGIHKMNIRYPDYKTRKTIWSELEYEKINS